jgi:hypothetical protein
MNWATRIGFGMAVLLGAGGLLRASPTDQAPASHASSNSARSASGRLRVPFPPDPSDMMPALPAVKSPVALFRELLAMSPLELKQSLTNRSPESQKIIRAKLREYAAMDADRREERLQATEMCWYLQPLLTGSATNRAERLASIPFRNRRFVADRLGEWDKLPADVQKDLLANKDTLSYLTEIKGLTDDARRNIVTNMSPARRERLQAGIEQWNRMPEEQRQKMMSRFNQFFDLTAAEKEKTLRTLSVPERRQIEKTLVTFGKLPPDQRATCIRAIEKYTNLNLAERQRFWKNAERWGTLTPSQRQAWRDLVNKLPPPLPTDFPPLPPSHSASRPVPAVATNGN